MQFLHCDGCGRAADPGTGHCHIERRPAVLQMCGIPGYKQSLSSPKVAAIFGRPRTSGKEYISSDLALLQPNVHHFLTHNDSTPYFYFLLYRPGVISWKTLNNLRTAFTESTWVQTAISSRSRTGTNPVSVVIMPLYASD